MRVGVKSQDQGIYSQCVLTFLPQGGEVQKGKLGSRDHKALALLFQDKGQWQVFKGSACVSSEPGANLRGFCHPQTLGRLRLPLGRGWALR